MSQQIFHSTYFVDPFFVIFGEFATAFVVVGGFAVVVGALLGPVTLVVGVVVGAVVIVVVGGGVDVVTNACVIVSS